MGSVVTEAHGGRRARRQGARGQLPRLGRRVREPEARAGAAGGHRAVLVPGRVRAALHGARIGRSALRGAAGRAVRDERRRVRAARSPAFRCRSAPRSASSRCSGRSAWRRCWSSAPSIERRRGGRGADARRSSQGAASRFRTVLMTALLAILGLMPAALSHGVGSETQRPFAVVIIGGLVTAVAVTLFVAAVGLQPDRPQGPDAGRRRRLDVGQRGGGDLVARLRSRYWDWCCWPHRELDGPPGIKPARPPLGSRSNRC